MKPRTIKTALAATAFFGLAVTGMALAEPVDDKLIIEGEEIKTIAEPSAHLDGALPELVSGWHYRDTETRAMQMDDFDNPGMIFVDRGLDIWNAADGTEDKSCASCHEGPESMAGLRAVTPRVDAKTGDVMNIEGYINDCRTTRMGAEAWNLKGDPMTDVLALISLQSRGELMNVAIDGPAAPVYEMGKEIYYTRYGQLELSCANCHEDNNGNHIRSDHLSQGHTNGFPVYRLKQAALLTAQHRFVGCVRDTRAETFGLGSDELNALELYVASRGNGLAVEGVSVRH
ncbi:sulfur oxidation c-type cytochrome SoxA [Pseudorhodobacter turbinis]|uniref:SoxAX cytochrome complex subunit A n=1 Tax=Pseudorhodobacter turbinis TaxID=2500533 RepID=A0A4P8EFU0_9RHOB|nr:sulfur oxidation c-type cytochrome SoxA [Pseudorhodobacter turbinis]QCO55649.1 sulfur oxidation c-type cytochrome SoxA [Pseudorhodobacter turbinis]